MWLVASNRNGVSSWEIHRALKVTQKTAWFLLHRVRLAMQDEGHGGKIGGEGQEVEVDETFIGGKARNMHKSRKLRLTQASKGAGLYAGAGKSIVVGMLERGGTVRTGILEERNKKTMRALVQDNVEAGTTIYSDEFGSQWRMNEYTHEVINHLEAYVKDNCHTNGLENFWSLLKRSIGGTYVSVEPFHLFRYVDEQAFRYNNRNPMSDADRFSYLVRKVVGKRLTYAELTGNTDAGPSPTEEVPF
jgi:hypothetical protein